MQKKHLYILIAIVSLLILYGCGGGGSSTPTSTCSDSDGGKDINVVGVVTLTDKGISTTYSDYCLSGSAVGEYYCTSGNYYSALASSPCPSGTSCSNGACVASGDSCSDSDGGIYTNVFGTISGVLWNAPYTVDDACQNSTTVIERFCNANEPDNRFTDCSSNRSCVNGACI